MKPMAKAPKNFTGKSSWSCFTRPEKMLDVEPLAEKPIQIVLPASIDVMPSSAFNVKRLLVAKEQRLESKDDWKGRLLSVYGLAVVANLRGLRCQVHPGPLPLTSLVSWP